MKKTLTLLLLFPLLVSWQQKDLTQLSGKVTLPTGDTLKNLTFKGVDTTFYVTPDAEGNYQIQYEGKKAPFYTIIGTMTLPLEQGQKKAQKVQFASPLYIQNEASSTVNLTVKEFLLSLEGNDANNNAIQECKEHFRKINQRTFIYTPEPDRLVEQANMPVQVAKTAIDHYHPNNEVKSFLISWAQLEYINVVNAAKRNYQYSGKQLPADTYDHIPALPQIVDYPYWRALGTGCSFRIAEYINQNAKTPEEQVKLLKDKFTTPSIIDDQMHIIISTYLFNFPYSPENLTRLEALTQGLHDRDQILENYKKTRFKPTHQGTGTGAKGTGTGTGTGTQKKGTGTGAGTGTAR